MKYFDNKSFVPRTIQSDSPLYRSRIKSLTKNKDTQERLKLYNYIKSDPNAVFTFYHGTSESIWNAIQEKGYFTSPKIRNMEHRESREQGLEEVFFTTSVRYANEYAERAEGQTKTKGIILELRIPIYYLKEVSDVILGTESVDKIYNEFAIPYQINEIIENKQIDIKQKAEAIKKFFTNKISEKTRDEVTIKHAVPIKFVVGNSDNSKSLWKRWIEENPRKYEEATELFPNDKDIYEFGKQIYLKLVKEDPHYYEQAITLFPNDKEFFYEIGKQGYLELVKKYPRYYLKAIRLFPNDKEFFYEIGKQSWFDLVETYPHEYLEAIELFPNDKEMFYDAAKEGCLQSVKKYPKYYLEAIEFFPNDKDIYEAGKQGYLQLVKEDPSYYYKQAIKLFPNDKDIYEAGKQGYLQLVKEDPSYYYKQAIKLFPEAKHEFDIAAGKITQEQPKQACGWYHRIKY